MDKIALLHRAKSEYAYQFDDTLHILLRTKKDDLVEVSLIWGDPFLWDHKKKGHWINNISKMTKKYQTNLFDYYFIEVKPKDLRVKYVFLLKDKTNKNYLYGSKTIENLENEFSLEETSSGYFASLQNFFNFPYLLSEDLHQTPSWVKDTVWYQIFPDRFYTKKPLLKWGKLPVKNNEIYGGNLKGITEKLPYLHQLGITGIYFTPIFFAPSAHKYDTIDYFKIDPSFGTNEDFKKLVERAHNLDIKVMLDGVFNHSGYLHPFFQDVIEKNEKSIYKNSFHINKFPVINFDLINNLPAHHTYYNLNFKTFAYTPFMPKWNTNDTITKKHLLDVVTYWIKEYDIDGWRLDVSNEISHDFLREIKKASRDAKKDSFILGENWDQSLPWLMGDQLDSVMNYDLSFPIWSYFEHQINLDEFKSQINNYLALTPKNVMDNMFNLLDSHDTMRITHRLYNDLDRVKLAYLFMFLSKGAPNIYYGGEVGMLGGNDPDNRRCMIWDNNENNEMYQFLNNLIKLRNKHLEFRESDYYFIDNEMLIFKKKHLDSETLIIINNKSYDTKINISDSLVNNYINLYNDQIIKLNNNLIMKKYSFLILKEVHNNEANN